MFRRNQSGFTIIETVLFLAISGLVLLIGFYGIGSRTQNAQYNDSIRDIESVVSRSLNSVSTGFRASGLNNRVCNSSTNGADVPPTGQLGDDPGSTSCITMGVVVELVENGSDDFIRTYQITGDLLWNNELDGPELSVINSSNPKINIVDVQQDDITWNTELVSSEVTDTAGNTSSLTAFGLIRSPKSSNLYPLYLTSDPMSDNGRDIANAEIAINDSFSVKYCLEGINGLYGSINFAGVNGVDAVIDSDDETCIPTGP